MMVVDIAGLSMSTTNGIHVPPQQKMAPGTQRLQPAPVSSSSTPTTTTSTPLTTSTPTGRERNAQSPTAIHIDSNSSSCSPPRDLQSPLSCSGGSPSPISVTMESIKSDSEREESDTSLRSASSPENNENLRVPPPVMEGAPHGVMAQMPTPVSRPNPPFKRRPGRPAGSTKKPKPYGASKSKPSQNTEYTLRKFFEIGGRGYNEYLEWVKKKSPGLSPVSAETQQPVFPTPTISVNGKSVAAGMLKPTSTQMANISGLPPYQHAHIFPQRNGGVVHMYRQASPRTSPVTSQPPELIPIHEVMGLPEDMRGQQQRQLQQQQQHHHQQHQQQQFHALQQQHAVQELQREYRQSTQSHESVLSSDNMSTSSDTAALDLSSKPRETEPMLTTTATTSPVSTTTTTGRQDSTFSTVSHMVRPTVMEIKPTTNDLSLSRRSPVEIRPTTATVASLPKGDINGNHARSLETTTSSTLNVSPDDGFHGDVSSWDVSTVVQFVASVPGCQEYAQAFAEHRIDGSTLPILTEEHLINFINMKLGPALQLKLALRQQMRGNRNS